jgi:hypothetical protein
MHSLGRFILEIGSISKRSLSEGKPIGKGAETRFASSQSKSLSTPDECKGSRFTLGMRRLISEGKPIGKGAETRFASSQSKSLSTPDECKGSRFTLGMRRLKRLVKCLHHILHDIVCILDTAGESHQTTGDAKASSSP